MADTTFDLQRHLEAMESRIRQDVQGTREAVRLLDDRVQEEAITIEAHAGRITRLEEKAGWIGAGFGAGFFALVAFAWHVIKSKAGVP